MTDEEVILRASELYADICQKSLYGKQRGMLIYEIRKKYNLKKRDLTTLFQFLNKCVDVLREGHSNYYFYKVTEKQKEEDKIELTDIDKIEWAAEDCDIENFDDDCYVVIEDDISLLHKKIDEDNVDITNASLLVKLGKDKSFQKIWKQVSRIPLGEEYIIDKGNDGEITHIFETTKKEWVQAIIKSNYVSVKGYRWSTPQIVLPLGLYFDYVTKYYTCVYCRNIGEGLEEIRLNEIEEIEICNNQLENALKKIKQRFNIHDYVKSIQTEIMKIKVYREGKVIYKLQELLKENQYEIIEYDDYDIISFKTDDPDEYLKVLNGFGKSVIVLEPERLQDDVIEMIDNTLNKYEMLGIAYGK